MTSRANGLGTLTLRHGSYALDPSATWNLMASTDDGATWTQVGDTMTTASPALSTASFDVNLAGNVRIAIKKLSGGRLDLDDISFTGFGATSVHLAMGMPTSSRFTGNDDYLLVKPQYALGYNDSRREANWVSWRLALSDLARRRGPVDACDRGEHAEFERAGFRVDGVAEASTFDILPAIPDPIENVIEARVDTK